MSQTHTYNRTITGSLWCSTR